MTTRSQLDKDIGELKGKFESLESKIADMHRILLGNGQAGITEKTIRLEENYDNLEKLIEMQSKQIENLKDSINSLKDILSQHLNTNTHSIWGLILRKDVFPLILLFFVILQTLIPKDLNIWELIQKIF